MKYTLFAITLFLTLGALDSAAQEIYLKNLDEVRAVSRKATGLFKENKMGDLFRELKKYWTLPENEIDGVEDKSTKSMNNVIARYGQSEEFTRISEQSISDFAFREKYIVRYKQIALRLIFSYYRNSNGWTLNAFKWDDNIDEEFK